MSWVPGLAPLARDTRPGRLDRHHRTQHESGMAKPSKTPSKKPLAPKLPASLTAKRRGEIAILRLSRPQKRNALDDTTILGIEAFFKALPKDIKAVVIHGQGQHFSAGLDLSALTERNTAEAVQHSRMSHRVF